MSLFRPTDERLLDALKGMNPAVVDGLDLPISIRLWDGTVWPLGKNADPNVFLSVSGPGVVGSLLRRPTGDNIIGHFARGDVDFHGTDLFSFVQIIRDHKLKKRVRRLKKWPVAKGLLPFLFCAADRVERDPEYASNDRDQQKTGADNSALIQFHYDVGNEFYKLFLDREMVYTCAYFTDWNNTLEQAQFNKLDMVCKKLRLKPGEKLLDMGCGWGSLVCHAAKYYGAHAHGVTLSEAQVEYANEKIQRLGLQDRVKVELKDYNNVEGRYDKISAIGMIEHLGIENIPNYVQKVHSMLPDRGMFLNHGITRPAKRNRKKFRKLRPEQKLLRKYIFPGGELDHIGHTVEQMEAHGFRVHDVEGWRDHYALTCKLWHDRLWNNREEAIRQVGKERFRLWLAYLAGVSFSLGDGTACLFQTVSVKHSAKGHSQMPPTREHLYEPSPADQQTRAA